MNHMIDRNSMFRRRIGILGGSFDPPTIGHLQLASQTLNLLGFDEVWLIPCGVRNDKKNNATAE